MATPFTDFWNVYLSAPLARHFTQTYWNAAPRKTTFAEAWDSGEDQSNLTYLAEKFVAFEEARPLKMYLEAVKPDGTKISGYDHNHFVFSQCSEIVTRIGGDLGERAWTLIAAHGYAYWLQDNSWLGLKNNTYGTTGRCRIAGMIVRYLCDVIDAARARGAKDFEIAATSMLTQHLVNIGTRNMADGPQGDGLTIPHWRVFQVGILIAALQRAKDVIGADTNPLVSQFIPIILASVIRGEDGLPAGFWYDVPEPLDVPQPWPGAKPGKGNGVELWFYRWLPADAQLLIQSVNPSLPYAVKAKFGMVV
jgi:hypothetical protein